MKKHLLYFIFILCTVSLEAQFAPDFTITDSDGEEHSLYADYLDHGKTVVIKLFFVGSVAKAAHKPGMAHLYHAVEALERRCKRLERVANSQLRPGCF